jgi:hypothetical protein
VLIQSLRSFEFFARIITTGLVLDPEVPWRSVTFSWRDILFLDWKPVARPHVDGVAEGPFSKSEAGASTASVPEASLPYRHRNPSSFSILKSATSLDIPHRDTRKLEAPFQLAIEKERNLSQRGRPYLRHSWHRVDFVSIVSYWIMFIFAISGTEMRPSEHLYIFRALSVLRITRLLAITSGTAVSVSHIVLLVSVLIIIGM